MLALFTFATVADSIYFARLTINNPYRDYGMFLDASAAPWYLTMGTVCNTIVILLGDGILVRVLQRLTCQIATSPYTCPGLPLLCDMARSPLGYRCSLPGSGWIAW